jgi:hypothetical protein
MKRKESTRKETIIEVSEAEMRKFLGLADDEWCFTIMGYGPYQCYISKK